MRSGAVRAHVSVSGKTRHSPGHPCNASPVPCSINLWKQDARSEGFKSGLSTLFRAASPLNFMHEHAVDLAGQFFDVMVKSLVYHSQIVADPLVEHTCRGVMLFWHMQWLVEAGRVARSGDAPLAMFSTTLVGDVTDQPVGRANCGTSTGETTRSRSRSCS